jgi:hypothetical protein
MACSLPAEQGVPLSRWSASELAREAIGRGIVEQISGVTVWRWLSKDAIKPWQHRSWIFPRDPRFAERAGPILDLFAGCWRGERLHPGDYVICADEKPSIQARKRIHPTLPARRGGGQQHHLRARHLPIRQRIRTRQRLQHRPLIGAEIDPIRTASGH